MAKRALIVGINKYRVAGCNLRGCLNDVRSLAQLLTSRFAFEESNISTLTDQAATRSAILAGLKSLLTPPPKPGDVLVFSFCGHGTQLPHPPEATTGKLEAIVPYEMDLLSLISNLDINKEIRAALAVNKVDQGQASVTCIYDSCHSGLMFRELRFSSNGKIRDGAIKNRVLDFGSITDNLSAVRDTIINPFSVFTACKDEETAADVLYNPSVGLNESRGAFSFGLHRAIADNPRVTPAELEPTVLATIRKVSTHPQNPQYAAPNASAAIFSV